MKLSQPFSISARLLPAIKIGNVTISYDNEFIIDYKDNIYHITDFTPGRNRNLQGCFEDIISFMTYFADDPDSCSFPEYLRQEINDNYMEYEYILMELSENENLIS